MITLWFDEVNQGPGVGFCQYFWLDKPDGELLAQGREPRLGPILRTLERLGRVSRTEPLQQYWRKRPGTPCWAPDTIAGMFMSNFCDWEPPGGWPKKEKGK